MQDAAIVELYWERDERAIAETASRYGRYCYTIAYNILANAEDSMESVNDTYLAAWNSMPPQRPAGLGTYLGKLTRRISLNRWRGKNAQKRGGGEVALALDELMACVPSSGGIDERLSAEELGRAIDAFLRAQKADVRRVFIRRYYHLVPVAEICAETGFSRTKVDNMLSRTRQKLREYLIKEGFMI